MVVTRRRPRRRRRAAASLSRALRPALLRAGRALPVGRFTRDDAQEAIYLNPPFFVGAHGALLRRLHRRSATLLRRWSRQNDARPSMRLVHRMRAPQRAAVCLSSRSRSRGRRSTGHVAASRSGRRRSSASTSSPGRSSGAIALVTDAEPLARLARPAAAGDARPRAGPRPAALRMVAFWAYMAFSQLLIYWIARSPRGDRPSMGCG